MESALVEALLIVSLLMISIALASIYGGLISYYNKVIIRDKIEKLKSLVLRTIAKMILRVKNRDFKIEATIIFSEDPFVLDGNNSDTLNITIYGETVSLNLTRIFGIPITIRAFNIKASNMYRIGMLKLTERIYILYVYTI